MRHISFCATLGVVALVGSASFAAQSYVSPDSRYTNSLVTQVADTSTEEDAGVVKCRYQSPDACGECSTCSDYSDCSDCSGSSDCSCSSCSSGCNQNLSGYGRQGGSSGIIAGYEFLWLKPQFSKGINYETYREKDDHGSREEGLLDWDWCEKDSITKSHGFDNDYNIAPRVWIGHQWCGGFAIRLRYWQYDHDLGDDFVRGEDGCEHYAPSRSSKGECGEKDFMKVENSIKADIIDLDFTQDFTWCRNRFTIGGGISYASLRMDRDLFSMSPKSFWGHYLHHEMLKENTSTHFEGIGPTVLLEWKRCIRNSGLSFVGGLRGTVLFGEFNEFSKGRTSYIRMENGGNDFDSDEYSSDRDGYEEGATYKYRSSINRTRAILTASIGVQYDREICCGTDAFVRLSWEGQYWNGFGSPVENDGDLAFQGLGIALGIRR